MVSSTMQSATQKKKIQILSAVIENKLFGYQSFEILTRK